MYRCQQPQRASWFVERKVTEPSAPVTFCVSVVICYRFLCGLSTFRRESVRLGGTYSTSWKFFKRNFLLLVCAFRKTSLFHAYLLFQLGMQLRVGLFCRITIVHFLNMAPKGEGRQTVPGILWMTVLGVPHLAPSERLCIHRSAGGYSEVYPLRDIITLWAFYVECLAFL